MRVSSWLRVEVLINRRNHLLGLLDKRVEVSLNGECQNREFVDRVEKGIRLEVEAQIHEIEQQLVELGVSLD